MFEELVAADLVVFCVMVFATIGIVHFSDAIQWFSMPLAMTLDAVGYGIGKSLARTRYFRAKKK